MKLSWGFIVSSMHCVAAAAQEGHVYIFDPTPISSPQASSTVPPTTVRLILAQRLGLSRFHTIEETSSEETLKQINAFGGRQQKLFGGEDADRTQAHALVWIDGVEDAQALIQNPEMWSSSFAIANAPPASDSQRLIEDMGMQAESLPQKPDPKGETYVSNEYIDHHLSKLHQPKLYNDYLSVFYIDLKSRDKSAKPSLDSLSAALSDLRAVKPETSRFSITLVAMPPSSNPKRTVNPYGTYDMSNLQARREPTEALMSLAASESAALPNNAFPDLEDFPVVTQADSDSGNNTTPPLGILPRCFVTESACDKATNGCSGHGKCSLLHKGESGSKGRTDCYGCVCKPTVVDKGDTGMETHKKTTYWGGPACQKKDVSVPFWLFAASGVLFAFLISGGIGLLYSVGSEELPSVIGAGVSGPVARK